MMHPAKSAGFQPQQISAAHKSRLSLAALPWESNSAGRLVCLRLAQVPMPQQAEQE